MDATIGILAAWLWLSLGFLAGVVMTAILTLDRD